VDATKRVRALTRVAAAAAAGETERLDQDLRAAVADGLSGTDLREAILQVFLFAGFPRAISAFERLELAGAEGAAASEEDPTGVEERGAELFALVYGQHTDRVLKKLERLHPDFRRMIVRDAYGRVLARPFLPVVERELMAVAMLAALDVPKPLEAHIRGAKTVGATTDQILAALDAAEGIANSETLVRARQNAR